MVPQRPIPLVAMLMLACLAGVDGAGQNIAPLYEAQVDPRLDVPPEERAYYAELLQNLGDDRLRDGPPQYVVLVDRAPLVQAVMLFWKAPEGGFVWMGASPASTGKPGEYEYFATPTGIFEHSTANLDYRAEGTRNKKGILGYGRRGMRVYDFGWVRTAKGWGDRKESVMRLQMHATDPDLLEPRLGLPMSKGCVRIPARLNAFFDHYGVLDADYNAGLTTGRRYFVLPPDREPVPWPGSFLVVVDSGRKDRPVWSPPPKGGP